MGTRLVLQGKQSSLDLNGTWEKKPINSCVGFISLLFLFCLVLFFLSCSDIVSVCCFFFLASSSRFQQVVRSNRQPGLTVKLISHQKREIYE